MEVRSNNECVGVFLWIMAFDSMPHDLIGGLRLMEAHKKNEINTIVLTNRIQLPKIGK